MGCSPSKYFTNNSKNLDPVLLEEKIKNELDERMLVELKACLIQDFENKFKIILLNKTVDYWIQCVQKLSSWCKDKVYPFHQYTLWIEPTLFGTLAKCFFRLRFDNQNLFQLPPPKLRMEVGSGVEKYVKSKTLPKKSVIFLFGWFQSAQNFQMHVLLTSCMLILWHFRNFSIEYFLLFNYIPRVPERCHINNLVGSKL